MRFSAVYSCVRVIAETLATVPIILYRRKGDAKERDVNHPLYSLLHDYPNAWQTAFEFKEMLAMHICLRGNAYAEIIRNGGGQPEQLIPLHPDRVSPYLIEGQRVYKYWPPDGTTRILMPGEMFHVPGLSFDGVSGLNPIEYQRDTIGDAIATREYGSKVFNNGAMVSGILKHPSHLSAEATQRLAKQIKDKYEGAANAGKTLILEEGMDFSKLGMTSQDAQFLENKKFQISDIARIFRVPPHLIGDLDRATFSNIEQQSLEFVQYTMLPWFTRFEQAVKRDLILKNNQFAEFLMDVMLRGDIKSRYDAYAVGRNWGWLNANEIRARENMNPVENGDIYLQPLNMQPAGQFDAEKASLAEPSTKEDLQKQKEEQKNAS